MAERKSEAIVTAFLFLQIITSQINTCESMPLSTNSRWIVDDKTGNRVKLTCTNWPSHLEPMIAEGLEKKPASYIASQIAATGFNCVRFTWPTFMFTRPDYYNLTVSKSLDKYNLKDAKAGVTKNNPDFLNMKVQEVHKAVVNELGRKKLMVVLDNHVSKPYWCCSDNDGNGFFGDTNFDPTEWLQGLNAVAKAYKGNPAVVGMSLRNELRGNRQNWKDWYKYMQAGAKAVHKENPDYLVIVSGISFATNLNFLKEHSFGTNLDNKLVYEAHWYTFGVPPKQWAAQTNKLCATATKKVEDNYLFLTTNKNPTPLFLSEFGINQGGGNDTQNRYISCLLATVAERDIDWALWAFQGSYILRQGKRNIEESYGVMDFNWDRPRNPAFLDKLQLIRHKNQELGSKGTTNYMMFHPQSGKCVQIGKDNNVFLRNCKTASRWDQHKDGGPIKLAGSTPQCLVVAGDGGPVRVSGDCSSKWKFVSSSGLHLAAQDGKGKYLCLDINDSDSSLVTKKCLCVGQNDLVDVPTCDLNPQVQWFKFVPTNVGYISKTV